MKVTIKKVEAYEVAIDGQSIGRFDKGSEWNGLVELVGPRGKVIVVSKDPIHTLLDGIFGEGSKASEAECVLMTPSLMPAVKDKPNA